MSLLQKNPECWHSGTALPGMSWKMTAVVIPLVLWHCWTGKASEILSRPVKSLLPASAKTYYFKRATATWPSLSLHFNGHFLGEPGLAGVYWSKWWWKWWWQLELSVVQSSSQIITTNKPTPSLSFLSPNQQCQSTESKISHPMDLHTPSSPGGLPTLSLATNSSWLPWGGLPCLSSALWCQYPVPATWPN